ncbi:MAG: glycosyltransferase family 87 protein [Planctomycetota bacterium]
MPDTPPDSRYTTIRLVTILCVIAFAVAYGFQCVKNGRAVKPPKETVAGAKKEKLGNDFTAFYSAGEQARLGQNIYDWASTSMAHRPYEYPPLFAVFPMMPLSYFPFNTALAIFYALNVLLLAASFWMLRRLFWPAYAADTLPKSAWQWPLVGLLVSLALSWRYIHSNTNESNANLYMLFLLTLAFYLDSIWKNGTTTTPRGGLASGLAVAMATAVKLTPGLFGVYFLWSRRGWSMLGGALGLVLFLALVPALFLGWETNLKYLDAYKSFALGKSTGAEYQATDDPNRIHIGRPRQLDPTQSDSPQGVGCSMRGVLTSLLTPAIALRKNGDRPRTVNIATLEPKQVGTIANGFALILLLVTIALTWSERSRQTIHAAALSWSLVVLTMALISPLTRIAHLVVLVIPIATLVSLIQQKQLSGSVKILAPVALVLLVACSATNEYLHAIGATTFSLLVLYVALALALRNQMAEK